MKRPVAALAALSAVALVTSMGLGVTASAAPAPNHLNVSVSKAGAGTLSTHFVKQGYLTLTAQDHSGQTSLTIVSVRKGHSINELLAAIDLQTGQNPKPADAAKSTRIINRIAAAYSGADIGNPSQFVSDTVYLPRAGDYYVVGVGNTAHNFGVLHASHRRNGNRPHSDGTLLMGVGTHDVFAPRGLTIPKTGTLRIANAGDSIHLMQMSRVANGVTDAQVQVEFDAILKGQQPTSDPAGLNSAPKDLVGSDAMTPHNAAYLSYAHLPRGEYLVLCFIADDSTGIPHAFMGMHLIIHVR